MCTSPTSAERNSPGSGGWLLALSVLLIAATVAGPLPRRLSRPATRQ
jgi:hypothetical protein